MTTSSFSGTSRLTIKVDGSPLEAAKLGRVVDVVVEQDVNLPDSFAIRLLDIADNSAQSKQTRAGMLDANTFPIGSSVDISLGFEETAAPILTGKVSVLELDMLPDGTPFFTARGYSDSIKLHRERKSKVFANVADSGLASQVAQAHGLQTELTTTSETYEHVYQDNLTDWEFLRSRAERNGFEVFVRGSKLYFRQPPTSGTPTELKYGENLARVRMRLAAAAQVSTVEVKGYDFTNKQVITGTASTIENAPSLGESRAAGALGNLFGTGKYVVAEQPIDTAGEANKLAQSMLNEIAGDFVQIEGTCVGDDSLRPGSKIKISGIGTKFSGTYYLTAVTHRYAARDGSYVINFSVSGRRPLTLSALLGANGNGTGRAPATASVHAGVVVGVVTNVKDPNGEGRVKVKLPTLGDQEARWARLATPMTGSSYGFYFLPEVNDTVLVAFEEGDVNHPYVVGSLWNGQDKPPKPATEIVGPDGKVKQRILKTRSGHIVTIDDSNETPGIEIKDKTGNNSIKLDSTQNALTIKVQGNMDIEAQGALTIKGANVTLEATGNLTAKATGNFQAKSSGTMTVESDTTTTVKAGASMTVQASGATAVKGSVVQIN